LDKYGGARWWSDLYTSTMTDREGKRGEGKGERASHTGVTLGLTKPRAGPANGFRLIPQPLNGRSCVVE